MSTPLDAPQHRGRLRSDARRGVPYLLAFAFSVALVTLWLHPWTVDWSGAFPDANDLLWNQAETAAHGSAGPIGSTLHLSWPFGYFPWSHPMLGGLWAVEAWLLTGPFGLPSALALYACWATGVGLTAMGILFLFRSVLGQRLHIVALALAVLTASSSFALTRVIQPNVAAYFLIPFAVGVAIRWSRCRPGVRVLMATGLVVLSLSASLWWIVVAMLLTGVVALVEALRKEWPLARAGLIATGSIGIGFVVQSMLYANALRPGAAVTRGPWDANLYGGHLVDIIIASPAVNAVFPRLLDVAPGASIGNSLVGLVPAVAAAGAVLVVLCGSPRNFGGRFDTRVLADATIASVLLFAAGGLGNLQAGLAVLAGAESPARVFSRLIAVLAVLGLTWALMWLSMRLDRTDADHRGRVGLRVGSAVAVVVLLAVWFADARLTPPTYPVAETQLPEHSALQFLRSSVSDCPVAQLPQEGMPVVRTPTPPTNQGRYFYRSLVPYVVAPEYFWTSGSWEPDGNTSLNALSTTLSDADLQSLSDQGFCAVFYDEKLAEAARAAGTPLEGRDVTIGRSADFASSEFSVYLLPRP